MKSGHIHGEWRNYLREFRLYTFHNRDPVEWRQDVVNTLPNLAGLSIFLDLHQSFNRVFSFVSNGP